MEEGAGDFVLDDPRGNRIDLEEYTSVDYSLLRRGEDAIAFAIAKARSEIKAKLRRCAAHLQGKDTSYFSRPGDLEAIRTLYRLADEFTEEPR